MEKSYNETELGKATETEANSWLGMNAEIRLLNDDVVKGKIEKVEFSAGEPDSERGRLWVSVAVKKSILLNQIKTMTINNN